MPTFRTLRGREIATGASLGRGGEGEVFEVLNSPGEAIKIYFVAKVPEQRKRKLRHMVGMVTPGLKKHAAWPTDLVENSAFGVVMPRVAGYELHDVYGPKSRMQKLPQAKFKFLVAAAYNLCAAVDEIHSHPLVIGDFNQKNVLVADDASVRFVDCDSFQVQTGGEIFRCTVGTPENLAPEAQGSNLDLLTRTSNQDNFSLAVLVFQLLFLGRHPFAGVGGRDYEMHVAIKQHLYAFGPRGAAAGIRPPDAAPRLDSVTPEIAALFERAFAPDVLNGGRPRASEWAAQLRTLSNSVIQCSANASHQFNAKRQSCPWCELYQKFNVSFFIIDSQHTFRIETGTFDVMVANILAAQPAPMSFPPRPKVKIVATPPPKGLRTANLRTFAGVLLLVVAALSAYGGIWVIAVIAGLWGLTFFGDSGHDQKCESHRRDLLAAKNQAQAQKQNLEMRVQTIIGEYMRDFAGCRGEAQTLVAEYRNLPAERQRRILELRSRLKEIQLAEFLDTKFIARAAIPGIGPERRAVLRSFGIETAADISWGMRVPGFGPTLKGTLVQWRTGQERYFRFDPTRPVDPREFQKVDAALLVRKQEIERKILGIKDSLEKLSKEASGRHAVACQEMLRAADATEKAEKDLAAFNALYPA
jgi:DNA-binding helix-hairpin-helix protein with protein kinase domain